MDRSRSPFAGPGLNPRTSAAEALAALKSEAFDVVLTDVADAGVDPLGLCQSESSRAVRMCPLLS